MIVSAKPVRDVDTDTFADVTAVPVTALRWADDSAEVTFAADLTDAEVAAVKRRMMSRNTNEEILRERAEQALDANRAYLAVVNPDAAAVRQQVDRLTRQNVAVMRMLLGFLDGTD